MELWDQDREIFHQQYFDNGDSTDTQSDSVAGDGRYNAGFRITFDKEPYELYTFIWTPWDRSPQRGESFTTSLMIMPYNGVQGRDDKIESPKNSKFYPFIK